MKASFILIILLLIAFDAFAQRKVSGYVFRENSEPAISASILEIGTNRGTITSFNGSFEFYTSQNNAELRISLIGYKWHTTDVVSDTVIIVKLEENRQFISPIVRNVSGIILDEEKVPIIGATIREVGTRRSTVTDFEGRFTLPTTGINCTLRIHHFGFIPEYVETTSDSVLIVTLIEDEMLLICHPILIFSLRSRHRIGVNYDITNALFGVHFDGVIIHRLEYGVLAQTNFNNDFGFESHIGLSGLISQLRRRHMFLLNYRHRNFSDNVDLKFNSIGLRGSIFFSSRKLRHNIEPFIEPAIQSLNEKNNVGLIVGIENRFWGSLGRRVFWDQRFSTNLSVGYFNNYWTYSVGLQYPFLRNLRLQTSYERIDRFNFFNIGLVYTISEIWRCCCDRNR